MLIFENYTPYEVKGEKITRSLFFLFKSSQFVSFTNEDGVAYKFAPTKLSDTLTITSVNRKVVEVMHHCLYNRFEHALLPAADTVIIRYNGREKPTYTSLCSEENNRLYRLRDTILEHFLYQNPQFMNDLRKGYALDFLRRKNPENKDFQNLAYPKDIEDAHYASLVKVKHTLDSLVLLGELPYEYESYYRYYLSRAEILPFYERQYLDSEFALTPQQYAFFNDSLANLVSYREYIFRCTKPYARNGTEWEIPFFESRSLFDSTKTSKYQDQRLYFDRLTDMQQGGDNRISAVTYDIMRYGCLEEITHTGLYPAEDVAAYLAKYKALTTRFLETKTVSASSSWGFPFRLLLFVLQLNICICVFYSLYRLLLYNTTSFVACRIFLLSGIVLSLVVALRLITVDVIIPESVLQAGSKFRLAGWVVLGIYGLSAVYLLFRLFLQLYHVWILRSDSWRIKDGSYLLCILKDIVTTPGAFFRMVFISWGDYFEPSSRENRDRILSHEEYHVRNLHSVDVMILMLLRFFCWFNPLFIKYMRELKQVNEYAADRSVVRRIGIRDYVRTLVDSDPQLYEVRRMLGYGFDGQDYVKRFEMIRRYGDKSYKGLLVPFGLVPVFILLMFLSPEFIVMYSSLPEAITTIVS